MVKLKSGRVVPEELLDEVIEAVVIGYAETGFEESLSDSIDAITQSLQVYPGWLPDNNNLSYEDACEVLNIVKEPIRQFANRLSDAYYDLRDKYIGTGSWEQAPRCIGCGNPLTIEALHTYRIYHEVGRWHKEVVHVDYYCSDCQVPLSARDETIKEILQAVNEL